MQYVECSLGLLPQRWASARATTVIAFCCDAAFIAVARPALPFFVCVSSVAVGSWHAFRYTPQNVLCTALLELAGTAPFCMVQHRQAKAWRRSFA
jgi:hypothetical protein